MQARSVRKVRAQVASESSVPSPIGVQAPRDHRACERRGRTAQGPPLDMGGGSLQNRSTRVQNGWGSLLSSAKLGGDDLEDLTQGERTASQAAPNLGPRRRLPRRVTPPPPPPAVVSNSSGLGQEGIRHVAALHLAGGTLGQHICDEQQPGAGDLMNSVWVHVVCVNCALCALCVQGSSAPAHTHNSQLHPP